MDRFKNYIYDHKHELEEEFREEEVWEQIRQNLSPIRRKPVWQIGAYWAAATIAAAVLVVVYITPILHPSESGDAVTPGKTANTNIRSLEDVFPAEKDSSTLLQSLQQDTEQNRIEWKEPVLTKKSDHKIKEPVAGEQDPGLHGDPDNDLDHKIRTIRSIPVYADRPDYFNVFIDQYHKIVADEQKLKGELGENKEEFNAIFSLFHQQKYFLLSQLQFEIEKMNARIMQLPHFNADAHYFISI
ncbi:MAG: hypothetical protein M9904_01810 [Chitinophagaceae bacterium]|nr:hypothetical protein [Chitinophagaceae bacterium]